MSETDNKSRVRRFIEEGLNSLDAKIYRKHHTSKHNIQQVPRGLKQRRQIYWKQTSNELIGQSIAK